MPEWNATIRLACSDPRERLPITCPKCHAEITFRYIGEDLAVPYRRERLTCRCGQVVEFPAHIQVTRDWMRLPESPNEEV